MPRGKGTLEVRDHGWPAASKLPSDAHCLVRWNMQIKKSNNPFFQTTNSNIGKRIEDTPWQAPEVSPSQRLGSLDGGRSLDQLTS